MATRHATVYRILGHNGGWDIFEVECASCGLSEVYATEAAANEAAGDHDDARHSE